MENLNNGNAALLNDGWNVYETSYPSEHFGSQGIQTTLVAWFENRKDADTWLASQASPYLHIEPAY